MQLILALAPGFRPIDFQVLLAIFPALVELTVKHQSYVMHLALQTWHTLGFPLPYSQSIRDYFFVLRYFGARRSL